MVGLINENEKIGQMVASEEIIEKVIGIVEMDMQEVKEIHKKQIIFGDIYYILGVFYYNNSYLLKSMECFKLSMAERKKCETSIDSNYIMSFLPDNMLNKAII